jgi:hypothetical protein
MNDNDGDLQLQDYQDDLDTDPGKFDRVTHEQTDDLTDRTGIPPQELAQEFEKMDVDAGRNIAGENNEEKEDMREHLEDADEDGGRLKSVE